MPFDFNWHDDDHTIIRVDIHGNTKWDEYHPAIDRILTELKATHQRIDVIFNDPQGRMPPGNPLPHMKTSSQKLAAQPNMGVIVVVSDQSSNAMIKILVTMVYRIYGINTRIIGEFVNTLEEAEVSIAKQRATASAV